jgi:hypothetical protein
VIERRDELTLSWRQNLGTPWLTTEVAIAGSHDSRTGDLHWGDLVTDVVVPLWRARYQAVALAIGARTPIGDRDDWLLTAGDFDTGSWAGAGELRGSFGVSLVTIQLRGGVDYVHRGVNTVEIADETIEYEHRRIRWDAAAGVGVRVLTWLRLGAEQRWTRTEWRARDDGPAFAQFDLIDAPLVAYLELSPGRGWHLAGWAGTQLAGRDDLAADERLVAGGSVAWVY